MSIDLRQPPRQSLVANINEQLREALLTGQLRPGERLKIRDLASRLGTSPTPVREALISLVAAGALNAAPGQAFQVPAISRREYMEICRIRQAVEGLAAEEAVSRVTDEDIEVLERIKDNFLEAKDRGDAISALGLNKDFRFRIYRASGMPNLLTIIESLWIRIGPCFNYLYPEQKLPIRGSHNYETLINALKKRDRAAVRAAIECAIVDGAEILAACLPEDGDRELRDDPSMLPLP